MSSLGMDAKGNVRSASEFKQLFDDTEDSSRPYYCPFCEVPYEDACIETDCVRAPHFRLPRFTDHVGDCTGEALDDQGREIKPPQPPKKTVVGDVELPEALVRRRPASRLRNPGDGDIGTPPSPLEINRRRKAAGTLGTMPSKHTTSQLRPIIEAFKRLKKVAVEHTQAANLTHGSTEYNLAYRSVLESRKLELYEQHLAYGNAFQSSKLAPWFKERIYYGKGTVSVDGNDFVITDVDTWPKAPKVKDDSAAFQVRISRAAPAGTPTSHLRALANLQRKAAEGAAIEWWAYGTPRLAGDLFTLAVTSIDHLYWPGQNDRI